MYYVVLDRFWWKWTKKHLKNNGKSGIKYVKSRKLGFWWVIKEKIREVFE